MSARGTFVSHESMLRAEVMEHLAKAGSAMCEIGDEGLAIALLHVSVALTKIVRLDHEERARKLAERALRDGADTTR